MKLLLSWLALGLLLFCSSCHAEKGLTGWTCVEDWGTGADTKWSTIAVRLSPDGYNPECASKDGKTCMRVSAGGYCKPYDGPKLDTLDLKPLRCGAGHQAAWGANNTGYNQGRGHWCNIVKAGMAKRPSGFTGAVCKSGSQCASGICVRLPALGTNQTSTRSTAINSFCGCRSSAQCGRLHYCGPGNLCVVKRYLGAACSAVEQCLSGSCKSGRCTCTADNHCPPDQYCIPAPPNTSGLGTCRPLKLFNQACGSSRECFTRLCLKGVCKDCTSNKDCDRTTCNTATNACGDNDNMVTVCMTSKDCPGGGICKKGNRCTCTTDAHCGSYARSFYRCRRAVNPADNVCLTAFKDGTCHSDRVCGVPSSEDAYEVLGKCIGKTCAQCAAPSVAAAWHPGESNLDNGMLSRTCNLQTYLYQ